jgi:DNA polymerase (family X)
MSTGLAAPPASNGDARSVAPIDGARQRNAGETNAAVADKLRQAAAILSAQGADPFRIAAYRRAADAVSALQADLGAIAESGGQKALDAIPGIGRSLAAAIAEMLRTGRWAFLEHLKGEAQPETLFRSVPGIGPALARRICDSLAIGTLEALEAAAYDGRLDEVAGFGHRRVAMVRAALAGLLGRVRRPSPARAEEPAVGVLLDVGREYREKASSGELFKIAPKRFNPKGEAWLPVLHTARSEWQFTALYSNTARAHQLGRITDWVVIFFHKDGAAEGQRTVVTETRGAAAGRRIVRGREGECATRHRGSGQYLEP